MVNCKYVFHTVGPDCRKESNMNLNAVTLRSCYDNSIKNVLNYNVKSIAFSCISTGIFKYDNRDAATVAISTVHSWLERNHESIDKIIFCTYEEKDYNIYNEVLSKYFPEGNEKHDIRKDGLKSSSKIHQSEHTNTTASSTIDDFPSISTTNPDFDFHECFPCDMQVDDEIVMHHFNNDEFLNECFPSDKNVPNKLDDHLMKANSSTIASTSFSETPYSIDHPTANVTTRCFPVKLQNEGVNVCFFNSICQVLYSIPLFHSYLDQINLEQIVENTDMNILERDQTVRRINILKNLFARMNNAHGVIQTSNSVIQFQFNHYTFRMQHDAQEALNEILETCFPLYI